MNLLFRVLYAAHCKSTHHKLAMDALRFLKAPEAQKWQNLFLKHHQLYLEGSKDPDNRFKDFRNHVLHVGQNNWGGAPKKAQEWYDKAVSAFQEQKWAHGVYAAGVLSHYYTDPIQPFHTGSSEEENNVHRAAEWSICKAYDDLWKDANLKGLPSVDLPSSEQWLADHVIEGAKLGHQYYWHLIENYDFDKGVKDPPAGLNDNAREMLTELIGYAAVGFSRLLDRLVQEAAVTPPTVSLTVSTFLATLSIPVKWVSKKLADVKERKLVESMHEELQQTGRVSETLPEDDRMVRDLVREELIKKPAIHKPVPEKTERPETLKFWLQTNSPVQDAPSIGPKTASRLAAVNVHTVADLLQADPATVATAMDTGWVREQTIRDWQDQARLVCGIPNLRGHDAQILVACEHRSVEAVASANPDSLLKAALEFAGSKAGERVIRSSKPPDAEEVADWIRWAKGESPSSQARAA